MSTKTMTKTTTNHPPSPFMQTTRKRGLMNRIRRGLTVVGLATLAFALGAGGWGGGGVAYAQGITGRVTGRVVDQDTGQPMGGVTVIAQGPQGEDATITDDKGQYDFTSLAVGTYVIRYYVANNATQVEQPNVHVSAEKTVRVNVKLAAAAQASAQQTYVITGQAPTVDIGSARIGVTFDQDFTLSLPINPDYGSVIAKAPGAFVDPSGNVSIGGATGLENIYVVNGMNVTGLRYGMLEAGLPGKGGGTDLPVEFLTQIDVNSGGYQAEHGGAMGGVINTVLKSGSNEFHGSVFSSYSPYWLSADPTVIRTIGSSIAGVRKPDFEDRFGFEVGGPIVKDKLFFWLGMAPQLSDSHVFRYVFPQVDDGTGHAKLDASGNPVTVFSPADTRRLDETHRTYSWAGTVTYVPHPDHKLELAFFGTPSFNNELRATDGGLNVYNAAFPSYNGSGPATWPQEELTKTNTDLSAHWTSKLFDRHWQIDVIGGLHDEYLYDRSPDASLNNLNQLQYFGSNLGALPSQASPTARARSPSAP